MIERCYTPSHDSYKRYGARGITVYEPWRASFMAFLSYVGERPTKQHSIDRIKNDEGYCPGNVRWATPKMQARNRSSTKLNERLVAKIRQLGGKMTATDIAAIYGLNRTTVSNVLDGVTWASES